MLQGTVAQCRPPDPRLALVDILMALTSIHRRFVIGLPLPQAPRRKASSPDHKDESLSAFRLRLRRIHDLRMRSLELSGCNRLEDTGDAIGAYRAWIDQLAFGEFASDGVEYHAAFSVRRDLHELGSILRIAHAFPESASRRAKRIAAK